MSGEPFPPESRFVPVTPGGTVCMWIAASTESEAWENLLRDTAHMPYGSIEALQQRGYDVVDLNSSRTST